MDEKIREELFKYRGDYYTTREALTAIKKIFYKEMRRKLSKKEYPLCLKKNRKKGIMPSDWIKKGRNDYRKETIKLLGDMCGVGDE